MTIWTTGHNLAGFLPETDPTFHVDRDAAVLALASAMREYADADDESAWVELPDNTDEAIAQGYAILEDGSIEYGDDAPSMRATVDAFLTDDGPDRTDGAWLAFVDDHRGWTIAFWIQEAPHATLEDVYDADSFQWCEGDSDVTSSPLADRDANEARVWDDGMAVAVFTREADGSWILSGSDVHDWTSLQDAVGRVDDPREVRAVLLLGE